MLKGISDVTVEDPFLFSPVMKTASFYAASKSDYNSWYRNECVMHIILSFCEYRFTIHSIIHQVCYKKNKNKICFDHLTRSVAGPVQNLCSQFYCSERKWFDWSLTSLDITIFEKLIFTHLVKKLPTFWGTKHLLCTVYNITPLNYILNQLNFRF